MPTTYQRKKRQGFMLYHDDAQYLSFFEPAKVKQIMQGLVELSCALADGKDPPAAPAELNAIELHTFNTMAEKIERDHGNYVHTCEARSRKEERPPNTQGDLSHLKASNSNGNVSETEPVVVPGTGAGNVHPPGSRTTTPSNADIQSVCEKLQHCGIHGLKDESLVTLASALLRSAPIDWIEEACNRACLHGVQHISYVFAILNNWKNIGHIDEPTKAEAYKAAASRSDGLTDEERDMRRRGLM